MTRDRTEWGHYGASKMTRDAVGSHRRQSHREHDNEAVCVNVLTSGLVVCMVRPPRFTPTALCETAVSRRVLLGSREGTNSQLKRYKKVVPHS